jgi:diaminopimelate decarboxylase
MATTRDERGSLNLGGVRLIDLARDPRIGTPAYVYDLDGVAAEARELHAAFEGAPHLVAYAVKANTAGPVVRTLAREGCGADVVSGTEMRVALACGVAPALVVFSGVAKTDDEIDAAIQAGIQALQVESIEELERVDARAAALGTRARVAIRINPGLDKADVGTHSHIATGHDEAKFGVPSDDVAAAILVARDLPHVDLVGLAHHVGSQLTTTEAYVAAAKTLFGIANVAREQGVKLTFLDTGGGFGIDYGSGCASRPRDFVKAVRAAQKAAGFDHLALHVEPGRALVGAHGVLLAKVIREKATPRGTFKPNRRWLIIDAGMNDLIRPALYQARHRVVRLEGPESPQVGAAHRVVGPVCESSDDFGEHAGVGFTSHVAILDAGAYGYVMASQYNGRPLPAEVFLRGGRVVALVPRARPEAWVESRVGIQED